MGVINKLKGRMSGYNALTRGPAKFDDFGFDPGYERSSATDAVSAGLAAGANQPEVDYEDRSQEIAEIGAKLGKALGSKIAAGESNRKKELDQLQEDNPKMTRGEARKKRRAKKKSKKVEDKINKGETEGKAIYYNPIDDTFRTD
jgi:hypothetical protein